MCTKTIKKFHWASLLKEEKMLASSELLQNETTGVLTELLDHAAPVIV